MDDKFTLIKTYILLQLLLLLHTEMIKQNMDMLIHYYEY